ncbi:MAG: rubrerythrin family protein [Haloarculaceae archaeon]
MHTADLLETVRTDHDTALSRLGSSKSVFAITAGDMDPDTVLAAMATEARMAANRFETWAAETAGDLGAAFGATAEILAAQADVLAGRLEDFEPGSESAQLSFLGDLETDLDRAGGLLGWVLVADRRNTQVTGYFTGQADPQTASLFRGFGEDFDEILETAGSALADRCDDSDDWDVAAEAAAGAVEAAYDDYVETLESMGVNPKPVC